MYNNINEQKQLMIRHLYAFGRICTAMSGFVYTFVFDFRVLVYENRKILIIIPVRILLIYVEKQHF